MASYDGDYFAFLANQGYDSDGDRTDSPLRKEDTYGMTFLSEMEICRRLPPTEEKEEREMGLERGFHQILDVTTCTAALIIVREVLKQEYH